MTKRYLILSILFLSFTPGFCQDSSLLKGNASCINSSFEGKITASGEVYKASKLTAAHDSLPFGTFVKVTNLENQKNVIVVINDRGPYFGDRIINLSKQAAIKIGIDQNSTARVSLEVVEKGYKQTEKPKAYANKEKEYYQLNTKQILPSGYGIQIASYAEIANLMGVANKINESIKKDLIIQVVDYQDSKVYRLILGPFKHKSEASKYRKSILETYPDCFVVAFKNN